MKQEDAAFDVLYEKIRRYLEDLDLEPRKKAVRGIIVQLKVREGGGKNVDFVFKDAIDEYFSDISDSEVQARDLRELIETLSVEEYFMHLREDEKKSLVILIDDPRVRGVFEKTKTEREKNFVARKFILVLYKRLSELKMLSA